MKLTKRKQNVIIFSAGESIRNGTVEYKFKINLATEAYCALIGALCSVMRITWNKLHFCLHC